MGSRRRKKNKRRNWRAGVPVTAENVGDLARPLRLIVESTDAFQAYLSKSDGDVAVAASKAMEDAADAAERAPALGAPFDAFDVLENVRVSQVPTDAEAYRETEHEGAAAVIELVALVLATRSQRAGHLPDTDAGRTPADEAIGPILEAARACLDAGSMAVVFSAIADAGTDASIQLGAVLREVFVRNLSYSHMVEDTLAELFDTPDIESDCRDAMGCTVREIREVFAGLIRLHEREWNTRFEALRDLARLAQVEMAKAAQVDDYEISAEARADGLAAWNRTWANLADASTFPTDVITAESGVDEATVGAILDTFSVEMRPGGPGETVRNFFSGRSPFRTRPILRDPEGTPVVVHGGLLIPAIRERVEQQLKARGRWERYAKQRGDYLERAALALLEPHFPTSEIHNGFEYFTPDPRAAHPQLTPAEYTRLVEGDGLLVIDDVAVIVEAKAGALTEPSRSGDARRIRSDLRKIVTSAARQADRTRQRIRSDGGLRHRDGSWIDLTHIREIHSIAVSLDDLSTIATVTSELVNQGILTTLPLPWTVSLHDLRIISEVVDRAAELLLYLRRRTEPDVTRRFHAVDELDFFLEFYASGLYVEPDPNRVRSELPQLGEPTAATKRRFQRQRLQLLTSRTDDLDAWYFERLGVRQTPARKPHLNANEALLRLVDWLAAHRAPGWLRLGTTLLDANGPTQRKFARYAGQLTKLTMADGAPHTMAVVGGARADNSFVLVWASAALDEPIEQAANRLRTYVSAKKHQLQVAIGAGLLFDPSEPANPAAVIYDNRQPGPDIELDEAARLLRLRPAEEMTRSTPIALQSPKKGRPRR